MPKKHAHDWERVELKIPCEHWFPTQYKHDLVWYVGYRCACGESGYALDLEASSR